MTTVSPTDEASPPRRGTSTGGALPVEDGSFSAESGAILWYLAEGTQFLPSDRRQRAEVLRWMFFEQNDHEPNIAGLRFWIMRAVPVTPLIELWRPARRASGEAALGVMDGHLADWTFFVGERYSIADIALYAYTHVAHEGGFDLAPTYTSALGWRASPRSLGTFRLRRANDPFRRVRGRGMYRFSSSGVSDPR